VSSSNSVPAERKSIQEVAMVCDVRRVSSYRGVMRAGKKKKVCVTECYSVHGAAVIRTITAGSLTGVR
jgi:hypothetical protein